MDFNKIWFFFDIKVKFVVFALRLLCSLSNKNTEL